MVAEERAILEADPLTPVKLSDGCSPRLHLGYNLLKDLDPEPTSGAASNFWIYKNCVR